MGSEQAGTWCSQLSGISVVPTKIKEHFFPMKTAASNVQLIFIKLEKKKKNKVLGLSDLPVLCFTVLKHMLCTHASGVFSCRAAITLRNNEKAASLRKRSQRCSYIQANQLVGFGKNTKMVTWTLYWYKKNWRSYLRKVKIYSCWSIFPHYPDVQDT